MSDDLKEGEDFGPGKPPADKDVAQFIRSMLRSDALEAMEAEPHPSALAAVEDLFDRLADQYGQEHARLVFTRVLAKHPRGRGNSAKDFRARNALWLYAFDRANDPDLSLREIAKRIVKNDDAYGAKADHVEDTLRALLKQREEGTLDLGAFTSWFTQED